MRAKDQLYQYVEKRKQKIIDQYDRTLERINLSKGFESLISLMGDREMLLSIYGKSYDHNIKEILDIFSCIVDEMYQDNVVLCGANSYEQKYYFNEEFQSLPQSVKDELHIMCVLFTEDVGGILTMEYDEKGNLDFQVISEEGDYLFDEIGSVLKIKEYQETKKELLEALELYYRTFFLGENVDWEEEKEDQEGDDKGETDEV